jgi:hypothetical protein
MPVGIDELHGHLLLGDVNVIEAAGLHAGAEVLADDFVAAGTATLCRRRLDCPESGVLWRVGALSPVLSCCSASGTCYDRSRVKSFFEGLEIWKYSDRRRYDNMKAIARINGAMMVFTVPVLMLIGLGDLRKGVPLLEILVIEVLLGVMFLFSLRFWQWGRRKD